MVIDQLNWGLIDWVRLQKMTVQIATNQYSGYRFEEYLKSGNDQQGIDVIGYKANEKEIVIQCRHVKKITTSGLSKLVNEFVDGEFGKRSGTFILCTTADLQSATLQKEISKQRDRLKSYFIHFDCWDRTGLSNLLKNDWRITSHFFGVEQADNFCLPRIRLDAVEKLTPLPDYIPRQVSILETDESQVAKHWDFNGRKLLDLVGLLLEEKRSSCKICLVGEAHYGKSSYLRQAAFLLKNAGKNIQPLFVEIKDWNIQPIEHLLESEFGAWRKIPLLDLVIIIDGLDEAPTDKFSEIVRHINEFSKTYPNLSIIVSCRSVFYRHYRVREKLQGFTFYLLGLLSEGEAIRYIQDMTGAEFSQFQVAVNKLELRSLLLQPFFLVYIVRRFNKNPSEIPPGRIQILDEFILESVQTTETRRLQGSEQIEHKIVQFEDVIRQFALAMQIAGTNVFTEEDLQRLFEPDQIELLKHSALVSLSNRNWSFTNALFQEHLAATLLKTASFEQIRDLSSIGKGVRKIRTKWIQTLASLLTMLDKRGDLYKRLLKFIVEDNLELIYLTESGNYPNSFRLEITEKLLKLYEDQHLAPMLINEDTIAYFIEGIDEAVEMCLNYLESHANERTKGTCARILREFKIPDTLSTRLESIVLQEVNRTDDSYYAGLLLEVLAQNKKGDQDLLELLMGIKKHVLHHEFRDKVYGLINALSLSDHFYSFGIAGIPILISYRQQTHHFGSEYNLQNLLLNTEKMKHLEMLFTAMQSEGWQEVEGFRGKDHAGFLSRLTDKCIILRNSNPDIVPLVGRFIRDIGKNYTRENYQEIERFVAETQSNDQMIEMFWQDMFENNNWELASFIRPSSFNFIFSKYKIGGYDPVILRQCFGVLLRHNLKSVADQFYDRCIVETGGAIKEDATTFIEYRKAEEIKLANDLSYIQSQEAFKTGVVKYFEAFGKKIISEDELYKEFSVSEAHRQADSNFIYNYLLSCARNNRKIYLSECLKKLDNEEDFEFIRAGLILHYSYKTKASEKILPPILEKYYLTNMPLAHYGNTYNYKDSRLCEIYQKYRFKTNEDALMGMVWLDYIGIQNNLKYHSYQHRGISDMIIEELSEKGLERFKVKILENLQSGIQHDGVLGTHINLCRVLHITAARQIIMEILKARKGHNMYAPSVADIYLELGESKEKLLELFKTIEDFDEALFLPLAKQLMDDYPIEVAEILRIAIKKNIQVDQKILIARQLSILGKIEGFQFLVAKMKETKKAPYPIQSGYQVFKVDTKLGLKELDQIGYMLLDPEYDKGPHFGESPRGLVWEWLRGFASKSEKDMDEVIEFVQTQQKKLVGKWSGVENLNWLIHSILNAFRDTDNDIKPISDVITVMKPILNPV